MHIFLEKMIKNINYLALTFIEKTSFDKEFNLLTTQLIALHNDELK